MLVTYGTALMRTYTRSTEEMSGNNKKYDSNHTIGKLAHLGCEVEVTENGEVLVYTPKGWTQATEKGQIRVYSPDRLHQFTVSSTDSGTFVFFDDRPDQTPQPVKSGTGAGGKKPPNWYHQ